PGDARRFHEGVARATHVAHIAADSSKIAEDVAARHGALGRRQVAGQVERPVEPASGFAVREAPRLVLRRDAKIRNRPPVVVAREAKSRTARPLVAGLLEMLGELAGDIA